MKIEMYSYGIVIAITLWTIMNHDWSSLSCRRLEKTQTTATWIICDNRWVVSWVDDVDRNNDHRKIVFCRSNTQTLLALFSSLLRQGPRLTINFDERSTKVDLSKKYYNVQSNILFHLIITYNPPNRLNQSVAIILTFI